MSYMNRQQRRALQRQLVAESWVLSVEYADGEVDVTAFASESGARTAFHMALGVKATEPDGILRVTLCDPKSRQVASSDDKEPS